MCDTGTDTCKLGTGENCIGDFQCASGDCNPGTGTCTIPAGSAIACSATSDCSSPATCIANTCVLAGGESCTTNAECASGVCDGGTTCQHSVGESCSVLGGAGCVSSTLVCINHTGLGAPGPEPQCRTTNKQPCTVASVEGIGTTVLSLECASGVCQLHGGTLKCAISRVFGEGNSCSSDDQCAGSSVTCSGTCSFPGFGGACDFDTTDLFPRIQCTAGDCDGTATCA